MLIVNRQVRGEIIMKPEIHESSFIDKTAVIIGNVKIGKNCGVFPNAVIRGDQNSIEIGDGSNIQDCCVLHVDAYHTTKIGKNVSIGHSAMIHGATIEDNCIIGIHATVLNGAKIGQGSVIGANALVTADMTIPKNSLVLGVPGNVVKNAQKFFVAYTLFPQPYTLHSLPYTLHPHP
jgi:carbonic anhydrase/acetyltransferase-like protein (isoleucine patch superfamily)